MNRRGFLAALAGAAAMDPGRLLWVPGKKLISIPKTKVVTAQFFNVGDIVTFGGVMRQNPHTGEKELIQFVVTHVSEFLHGTTFKLARSPVLTLRRPPRFTASTAPLPRPQKS